MKLNFAPRVQAIVLLLLVATSSALAGIVGDRLISDRQQEQAAAAAEPPRGHGPWQWEPRIGIRYGERLYDALDLTDAQRAAIDSIVAEQHARVRELNEEMRPRFRAIAEQTRGRIEGVLTADQQARLSELRAERVRAMRESGGAPPMHRRDGPRRHPDFRDSVRRERVRTLRGDTAPAP